VLQDLPAPQAHRLDLRGQVIVQHLQTPRAQRQTFRVGVTTDPAYRFIQFVQVLQQHVLFPPSIDITSIDMKSLGR